MKIADKFVLLFSVLPSPYVPNSTEEREKVNTQLDRLERELYARSRLLELDGKNMGRKK